MARTALTVTDMADNRLTGIAFSGTAGIADGHSFTLTGNETVLITKSGTSGVVTFQTPGTCSGETITPRAVTVETTDNPLIISKFNPSVFKQTDGTCYVDYAASVESEFSIMVYRSSTAS